ncbi:MAG: 50S ribosomal protein L30 [Ignavibacteria bacterium GWA2_55_11]|nr:MAG: 50S ribosomal protein L30 [Ignavibacteria bacterium GWA2_55_11]OGU43449.1 MAG: 50S ribosomal protein L30 [Ignavibacteria bacterium GWC2_56_12]OGU64980.1 MAG: 50S ribosomal protein L30 [Ignavibacteria bacterium RIFCSPHIGHO2_02_FULL_56_12]OGU71862.1 MAG: 50S ribosomal protein L30 [Ignavibacteria bacterium RIFCSPLOWO2_12_FULL_56_21]OGU74629.1 MAG: 50S ribosomal protein L30 [Ignavibacteria bacterium RIFCSPLOWO2_02_FULL_55_14]HAV24147.1 50S ribosomal protein L30 [Bacteroidota bacterium]
MADVRKIRITQRKSVIDELENAKRTIKALGLGRPRSAVVHTDTPQIRGMINAVRHLVTVEEVKS